MNAKQIQILCIRFGDLTLAVLWRSIVVGAAVVASFSSSWHFFFLLLSFSSGKYGIPVLLTLARFHSMKKIRRNSNQIELWAVHVKVGKKYVGIVYIKQFSWRFACATGVSPATQYTRKFSIDRRWMRIAVRLWRNRMRGTKFLGLSILSLYVYFFPHFYRKIKKIK